MIKINLCPIDELESQYWYIPDLVTAAVFVTASFFGVQYYLGAIQDRIDHLHESTASLTQSYDALKPDLTRYTNLDKDIKDLRAKIEALQAITVSKISKYKPVIVIEHMQNLKPDGVWYKTATFKDDHFDVTGQAFDNLLVAELMTSMRATGSQDMDSADLRTQVYFDDLSLTSTGQPKDSGSDAQYLELVDFPVFHIGGKIAERTQPAKPEPMQMEKNKDVKKPVPSPAAAPISRAGSGVPDTRF